MQMTTISLLFRLFTAATAVATDIAREKRSDDATLASLNAVVQQQTAVLQTLQARLTATESELHATKNSLHALQTTVQAQQSKLDLTSKAVAFSGRISARDNNENGIPIIPSQTIIFDIPTTNIGQAYNTKTGIFTAPVAGVYVFYLNIMCPNQQGWLQIDIVQNGNTVETVFAEGTDDLYDQGSKEVAVHLAGGDQVWVRQNMGTAMRGSQWTVFTGFLLQAD